MTAEWALKTIPQSFADEQSFNKPQGEYYIMQWANLFNSLKFLIIKYSGDSLKKRDFFSCVLFIEFGFIVSSLFSFLYPLLNECYKMTNSLFHFQKSVIEQKLYVIPDMPNYIFGLKFLLIYFISSIPFLILFRYNIKRGIVLITYLIIQGVLYFIFFKETRWVLLMLFVIFLVSNIFVPFGGGAYFNPVIYLSYIMDVVGCEEQKNRNWKKVSILISICCLGFVFSFKWLFPIFSIYLIVLLFLSIVLLLWINSSKNVVANIIKKIFVYAIFIPFILLNNNSFELNIQNIALVIIAIFFSIDRVINLIKDLKKIIETESNRYLIDEVEDNDKLIKEKLYITKEMSECLSEKVLIRQILIYWKLGLLEETKELIKIYNDKNYQKENMAVKGIDYFLNVDESVQMSQREKYLEKIFENTDESISFWPLVIEYAFVLFYLDKNYYEIKTLLKEIWLFVSDEAKYVLYYAYLRLDEIELANQIKTEIPNFAEIESKMKSNRNFNEEITS